MHNLLKILSFIHKIVKFICLFSHLFLSFILLSEIMFFKNPFKPRPTFELCRVECGGIKAIVLGSESVNKVRNDGTGKYTVKVLRDNYGEVAGALGGVLGKSVLKSEKKRRDGDSYCWTVSPEDYLLIANFEAKKWEMISKSQSPKTSPSNLPEEIVNRQDSWKPPHPPYLIDLYSTKRNNHPSEDFISSRLVSTDKIDGL